MAAHLNISTRHLINLRRAGLPYVQLGSVVHYDPVEVGAYLKANRRVPSHGAHQAANCALAVSAAAAFLQRPLRVDAARRGLAAVRMPARLETVIQQPMVVVDGTSEAVVVVGRVGLVFFVVYAASVDDGCSANVVGSVLVLV